MTDSDPLLVEVQILLCRMQRQQQEQPAKIQKPQENLDTSEPTAPQTNDAPIRIVPYRKQQPQRPNNSNNYKVAKKNLTRLLKIS